MPTPTAPRTENDLRDGLMLGLIAFVVVAAFYNAFDLIAARGPFHTVNLLGRSVFHGIRDAAELARPVPLDTRVIEGYNALHLALSLGIGVVVMRLVGIADREPARRPPMLLLVVGGYVATVVVVGWVSAPIRDVLPWWSIAAANTLAVLAGTVYVVRRRPGIVQRLLRARH
jgi:hypothetical protein